MTPAREAEDSPPRRAQSWVALCSWDAEARSCSWRRPTTAARNVDAFDGAMASFAAARKRRKRFYVGLASRHWSGGCLTRLLLLKTPPNCSFSALLYGLLTMAVAAGCASIPDRRS